MGKLFDDKPSKAVGGNVMRRTDAHIRANNKLTVTRSGDQHIKGNQVNDTLQTYPDSHNNWGKTPLDEDWVDE